MHAVLRTLKNVVLDVMAMVKGFLYGFVMIGLFIVMLGVGIYGVLYLRNVFL